MGDVEPVTNGVAKDKCEGPVALAVAWEGIVFEVLVPFTL
jgi:hypothetical protein